MQTISWKFDMFLLLAYYPQTEIHFTELEHSKTYIQTKFKGICAPVSVFGASGVTVERGEFIWASILVTFGRTGLPYSLDFLLVPAASLKMLGRSS